MKSIEKTLIGLLMILASLHSRGWPDAHHGDHHAAATDRPPFSPVLFAPTEHHGGASVGNAPLAASRLDSPATFRTLFWMALFTAGLTAFYTFRAVFMTFTGPTRVPEEAGHHAHESLPHR